MSEAPAPATTSAAPEPTAGAANPVRGKDICDFLEKSLPGLRAVGTPVGATAQLTGNLFGWIQNHPEQNPRSTVDIDDAARAACPDSYSAVLAAIGTKSIQAATG